MTSARTTAGPTTTGGAAWPRRHLTRLAVSGVVGIVAGIAAAPLPLGGWLVNVLVGVSAAMLTSALWVVRMILTLGSPEVAEHFSGVDGSHREVELISLGAALAALVGVGVLMTSAQGDPWAAVVGLVAVASGWLSVHTTYTLSYAKHWMTAEPGCIDFPSDAAADGRGAGGGDGATDGAAADDADRDAARRQPPPLSDFAYIAFSVGMTYQVSDTTVKSPAMRLLVWKHSLLSFLFGTVVIASSINLVASLAGSGSGG